METNKPGLDYSKIQSGRVIKPLSCGCTVDGWGVLPDPWTPILCQQHKAALDAYQDMLEALEKTRDTLQAKGLAIENFTLMNLIGAAIAKAKRTVD